MRIPLKPFLSPYIPSDLDLISKVKVGHSSAGGNISIIFIYPGVTDDVIILLDTEVP